MATKRTLPKPPEPPKKNTYGICKNCGEYFILPWPESVICRVCEGKLHN